MEYCNKYVNSISIKTLSINYNKISLSLALKCKILTKSIKLNIYKNYSIKIVKL